MSDFNTDIRAQKDKLSNIAAQTVSKAVKAGADECAVDVGGASGISVSARSGEVENIEFNRDNGMSVTVYRGHRRGSASTTDLSPEAIASCIDSAMSIASFADADPCAGIADRDLLCQSFKDLKVTYPGFSDPDEAVQLAVSLDRKAAECKDGEIRGSDGASASYTLYTGCFANSNGFCRASASSICSADVTLLGQQGGVMQRGSSFTVARRPQDLMSADAVVAEAERRTRGRLGAHPVKTGKYSVIFTRGAAQSLIGNFAAAIGGGAIYRRRSFLCDMLGKQVMPKWVTITEDPTILGSLGAANCDGEGVSAVRSQPVTDGVLKEYLLASYSARKLGFRSNGHSGGIYNWFVDMDGQRTLEFDELLRTAGEGIVVDELMGQGADLASGNYSRGAAGYWFKNGEQVHPVSEITIAGNLRDMFMHLEYIGKDRDPRYKVQCGSLLVSGMTVSGN